MSYDKINVDDICTCTMLTKILFESDSRSLRASGKGPMLAVMNLASLRMAITFWIPSFLIFQFLSPICSMMSSVIFSLNLDSQATCWSITDNKGWRLHQWPVLIPLFTTQENTLAKGRRGCYHQNWSRWSMESFGQIQKSSNGPRDSNGTWNISWSNIHLVPLQHSIFFHLHSSLYRSKSFGCA